ncbi:MAG TPA: SDR family NAD(P)-dependent oxidoreductase [Phototrophicaceae bacterium]|nr:SDR family NAD(P)-dependent oxidoreductase [Phototrophicaceae bacterium]
MRDIVITGGTDGMGKITAIHFLKRGDRVTVIGSTPAKGQKFLDDACSIGAADRATFIRADLSSISENQRIIETTKNQFDYLDMLILCAGKFQNHYTETVDGLEMVFATYYLSRYLLSYGLKDLLEKAPYPIIFNVAAPGGSGDIQWDDLGFKANYNGLKASFHGSRLNDLLGVAFTENNPESKIKYILYNPGFVGTDGVTKAFDSPVRRFIVNLAVGLLAKSPEAGAQSIIDHLENPPTAALSAFKQRQEISLASKPFHPANAQRLLDLTSELLKHRSALVSGVPVG